MSLLSEERKQQIMDELNQTGKVTVMALSESFSVSTETVRRDLTQLENEGVLKKVYGGAVKVAHPSGEPPFLSREQVRQAEKKRIGEKAAAFIADGDTILIDVGTTTVEFVKSIENKENITILTNSIPVAEVLMDALNKQKFTGNIVFLGGQINAKQQSTSGKFTEAMLEHFHIDKVFLSVGGVSLKSGVSDYDLNESLISQAMISVSNEVIVLADHSKIGVNAFCKIASLDAIDVIITDQSLPESWRNEIESVQLNWVTAGEEGGNRDDD